MLEWSELLLSYYEFYPLKLNESECNDRHRPGGEEGDRKEKIMNHEDPVSLTPPPAGYTEWLKKRGQSRVSSLFDGLLLCFCQSVVDPAYF